MRLVQQFAKASGDPEHHVWQPCWQYMVSSECKDMQERGKCAFAHANHELHPFVQVCDVTHMTRNTLSDAHFPHMTRNTLSDAHSPT